MPFSHCQFNHTKYIKFINGYFKGLEFQTRTLVTWYGKALGSKLGLINLNLRIEW